jgi:hypothetical protein
VTGEDAIMGGKKECNFKFWGKQQQTKQKGNKVKNEGYLL